MAFFPSVKTWIAKQWAKRLLSSLAKQQPLEDQKKVFRQLIRQAKTTAFGRDHHFERIHTYRDFQKAIPIRNYEELKPYFDKVYAGEADVLWKGKPLYLAKTSGTTSGAKYIPITSKSIRHQIKAARDALLCYVALSGNAEFVKGKMMFLSGSPEVETNAYGVKIGRLSGIVNHFVPQYLQTNRVPTYETNCMEDWEEKVAKIVQEIKNEDLRLISGIPPWVQMLFEEALRQTGKQPLELWKNLQVFIQGGVDFSPYQPVFEQYFQGKIPTIEVYPASEGFIAYQDNYQQEGMRLLTQAGIFYEFIPLESYGSDNPTRLTLEDIEIGKQYALILSTNAGLWAYDIGDTIRFISKNPYKIKVSGRVKHFLSAFGEHIIVEEVNTAMQAATIQTQSEVMEFTVAPLISPIRGNSRHEWLIEFTTLPVDTTAFAEQIDTALKAKNSYYKDLRDGGMLDLPKITPIPLHTSRAYMRAEGKLGGQNKFPRLSNNRQLADVLLKIAGE